MTEIRVGSRSFYKGCYFITFYDKNDEFLKYMFDNVREILKFQKKEVSAKNINNVNIEIYRACKTKTHATRFLTGETLVLHLIKIDNEDFLKEN